MSERQHRRVFFLIAAIAIGIAALLLLAPQGHTTPLAAWLALLPVFFVGLLVPLGLFSPLAFLALGSTPDAPAPAAAFQRPPPFRRS